MDYLNELKNLIKQNNATVPSRGPVYDTGVTPIHKVIHSILYFLVKRCK